MARTIKVKKMALKDWTWRILVTYREPMSILQILLDHPKVDVGRKDTIRVAINFKREQDERARKAREAAERDEKLKQEFIRSSRGER